MCWFCVLVWYVYVTGLYWYRLLLYHLVVVFGIVFFLLLFWYHLVVVLVLFPLRSVTFFKYLYIVSSCQNEVLAFLKEECCSRTSV